MASCIFIIAQKQSNPQNITRAMKYLLKYLRNDQSVFTMLKPNRLLLRKINIERHILSSQPSEAAAGLELASFLLRYHADIDYSDFTDDPAAIQKLKRYEGVKYAAEVEQLAKSVEEIRFQQINGSLTSPQSGRNSQMGNRKENKEPLLFQSALDVGSRDALLALREVDQL